MNSIGGYFELELRKGKGFHPNAIALNTGRNALELILKVKKYKKVYIPFYACDVILEPFEKTKIPYEFYPIDDNFEPIFDYSSLKHKEGFLYINYFGLKNGFITKLIGKCKNLIIDNSQAFFAKPFKNIPTFYSCRKLFGVPDGAYLYLDNVSKINFPFDHSESRFIHLLKRIEYGAEEGYNDFKNNDHSLIGQPIKQMSRLTKALLCNIDYEYIRNKRRENFLFLSGKLSKYNELEIKPDKRSVPMVYPFLIDNPEIKDKLKENKIFTATYWPNVSKWVQKNSIEYRNASKIVFLPIDQRYGSKDLIKITNIILK